MADFFTSDHHFGHKNIIKYCNRPFDSVEDMNHGLMSLWNETVTPEDNVYVIGDVFLCKTKLIRETINKLNGKKILIMGNHDKSPNVMKTLFDEVYYKYNYNLPDGTPVVLQHHPNEERDYLQIHGHVHAGEPMQRNRINVCVDLHDYRPVSLPYIQEAFASQKNLLFEIKTAKELQIMSETIKITEEQFKTFLEVQEEGEFNTLDFRGVEHFLTREEHRAIIKNYEVLKVKYEYHIL